MNESGETTAPLTVEISPPKRFGPAALLICCGYGILVSLPALSSILVVSSLPLSWLTAIIPFLALAAAVFLLPFAFGNSFIFRIARSFQPDKEGGEMFLVQFASVPRLRKGLRAWVEDADDVGWLTLDASRLKFRGDSVNLVIPVSAVAHVRRENNGVRGLFLYSRTVLHLKGGREFCTLRFAERSSYLLPTSRRTGLRLFNAVRAFAAKPAPA